MTTQPKAKKKPKRHQVNVGDLVTCYTPAVHIHGILGEIIAVLDKNRVVAKCLAPNDPDFEDQMVVLLTAKPTGHTAGGEEKHFYANYITKVAVRAGPKPKKKKKKVLPAKVIETQSELLEHLRSESDEKVVLHLAPEEQQTA